MSRRGLPTALKMRHDAHYVDALTSDRFKTFGRYIAIEMIDPNPEQPRTEIGDLGELTASIADKGVLEPLLVRPVPDAGRWMIIAGERRWRAATAAGLEQVPCIEMEIDDQAVAEIALIENLQRKDLSVWEEADALQALVEKFGYTHEELARKLGKSRTTVTETLALTTFPIDLRDRCRRLEINSKSQLLQILRQPTDEHAHAALETIEQKRSDSQQNAEKRRKAVEADGGLLNRPAKYTLPNGEAGFVLQIKFNKAETDLDQVAAALRFALENVEAGKLMSG